MAESSDQDEFCSILGPDDVSATPLPTTPPVVSDPSRPKVIRVERRRAERRKADIRLAVIVFLTVVAAVLTAKVGLQASVLQKQQARIDDLVARLEAQPASASAAVPEAKLQEVSGRAKEELFRLNSYCADLGKKFLEENNSRCAGNDCTVKALKVQGGGYQTVKGDRITDLTQASYYDADANRCYVELTEYVINSKTTDVKLTVGLYDGQTGQKLASYGNEGSRSSETDHWGAVNDSHHSHVFISALDDEEDAKNYINAKMGR